MNWVVSFLHLPKSVTNMSTHVGLNWNSSPHHMTLIKDHSTAWKGVKIDLHSSTSLIKDRCQVHFPYKYQPSSGLSSSLLMKTSCLRLKLVELNFFASYTADDQRKTYVSDVSKYTFKSSRLTFSIIGIHWCCCHFSCHFPTDTMNVTTTIIY